jgi:hypothetical protein
MPRPCISPIRDSHGNFKFKHSELELGVFKLEVLFGLTREKSLIYRPISFRLARYGLQPPSGELIV